jgi:hypothetical protein
MIAEISISPKLLFDIEEEEEHEVVRLNVPVAVPIETDYEDEEDIHMNMMIIENASEIPDLPATAN